MTPNNPGHINDLQSELDTITARILKLCKMSENLTLEIKGMNEPSAQLADKINEHTALVLEITKLHARENRIIEQLISIQDKHSQS